MEGFLPESSFGPKVVAQCDDVLREDEDTAAAFLADLAQGNHALEFTIGIGRIALPLLAKGIQVDGIELSLHMVEQLQAKSGGQQFNITIGDMSVATTGQQYSLVHLVYNTIFNLFTADDQIRCFENAARHLTANGYFVVETALPRRPL